MADKSCSIGVDLGGTKIASGVVTDAGKVLASVTVPTESQGGYTQVIHQISQAIKTVAAQAGISMDAAHSVGIGFAGQVDHATGTVHHAPNLFTEREIPFGPLISERLGLPVILDNDVRSATLGEYLFGFTTRVESLYNVFAGTGIGSGYIARGRILRGFTNSACELGHHSIQFDGIECHCGNRGCMEQYTGGLAVHRLAREAMEAHKDSALWELTGNDPSKVTGQAVATAAQKGDVAAVGVIAFAARALGVGLANAINIFNPEVIMLGGGLMKLGETFRETAEKTCRERGLKHAVPKTRFVSSQLGDAAGLIGASCLWRIDADGGITEA